MKFIKINIGLFFIAFGLLTFNCSYAQTSDKKELSVEEVFKTRDKNEDGKLSKDELIGFVSNDFTKLDTDKDGFISKNELAKSSKFDKKNKRSNDRKERPSIEGLLAEMDTNKDGKLSKDEVKGPLADDFSKIDSNKDGFLSKEELEKAPKPQDNKRPQGPPRN